MVQSFSSPPYVGEVHRTVRNFVRKHPYLAQKWPEIEQEICQNPRLSGRSDHLKGAWLCDYRWHEGDYRIKYEILEQQRVIHFYDATLRGQAYKGGSSGGRGRRR